MREMSELERVRERMARKMQARLRELEEQDVADSWEDEPVVEQASEADKEPGGLLFI